MDEKLREELREAIGRALYNASFAFDDDDIPTWDELSEDTWMHKGTWIARAEKVVVVHNEWMYQYFKRRLGIRDEDEKGQA